MKAEVLVTGCFNVLHSGHCELLEFANRFGRVTVGLNADWYLKEKYGDKAVPLINRAYCLRSNKFVEDVVFFSEPHPGRLIYKLRPRFFVRGPDYSGKELPEMDAIHDVGAKLLLHQVRKKQNASDLVDVLPDSVLQPLAGLSEGVVDLEQPVEPLGDLFTIPFGDSQI